MTSSTRVLNPIERVSEVLFGLIMVLTFTGSLSVAEAGRDDVRTMLIGALGCNVAWGIIDAMLYLMGSLAGKSQDLMTYLAVRKATDPHTAQRLIADALPPVVASILEPAELETMRRRLIQLPEPPARAHWSKDDWLGSIGVFLIVFVSTFPVAIPFIFMQDVGPGAERAEQPRLHGLYERQPAPCHRHVHILQVDVDDSLAMAAGELAGIDAAEQQVPGVQAPADLGEGERALDVGGRLDLGAGVRVQREREPVLLHPPLDLGQVARQAPPGGVVELARRRPAGVGHHGRVEDLGARRGQHRGDALRLGGVELGLVQHERHEAADEPEPVAVEHFADDRRLERQIADRAQLGRPDAERGDLAEHALGGELVAPAGDLADAPGDRRSRQAVH